uniref:Uncharacterized protein n=1 Tax=Rhizophora mucronata TaxID=61149 RepID=A0A2P2QC68_RHIMU
MTRCRHSYDDLPVHIFPHFYSVMYTFNRDLISTVNEMLCHTNALSYFMSASDCFIHSHFSREYSLLTYIH